ncbi:MAG: hypothetical protein MUC62_01005 [Candidatus Thermoplasmatota archaeon]|nr:hypothetical protein [Candidatus Thermoplasmatota archaeon]
MGPKNRIPLVSMVPEASSSLLRWVIGRSERPLPTSFGPLGWNQPRTKRAEPMKIKMTEATPRGPLRTTIGTISTRLTLTWSWNEASMTNAIPEITMNAPGMVIFKDIYRPSPKIWSFLSLTYACS